MMNYEDLSKLSSTFVFAIKTIFACILVVFFGMILYEASPLLALLIKIAS